MPHIDDVQRPAQARFAEFLDGIGSRARVVVFCHLDADGLAADALLARGLRAIGHAGDVQVGHSLRGENAFSDAARERLRALRPDALFVADLGVHAAGVLAGVPTC